MRRPGVSSQGLVALGLLAGAASGFVVPLRPAGLGLQQHGLSAGQLPAWRAAPVQQRRTSVLRMLKEPQGADAFTRVVEQGAGLNPLSKLPSAAAKVVKFTTIPLAAAAGFVLTPAGTGILRVCGGAVGGLTLKVCNDKLREMRQQGARLAVGELLLEYKNDLEALTPELLKSVTAKYDVEYAAHLKIMSDMYTQYLLAMLDWHEVRMGEPQDLVDLSSALGLDSSTIGDAHCAAAEEVASRLSEVPFDEREDAWEQRMVNKLLFLSNRLFAQLEEEETREYELGRVTEILGLSSEEGAQRIQSLVLPYYTNIVKSGVDSLRSGQPSLDAPKLKKWRQSLGLSEAQANRVNNEAFAVEVKRCVEAGSGRVRDGDADFLTKARTLLSISGPEAEKLLESVTAPLLRQSILEMLTSLTSTDPSTWPDALHKVRLRQKELKMVDSALVFHLKDVYRERLRGLVRQVATSAPLSGESEEEKTEREAKLRKVVGASLLLVRLMRQFLEVNNLEEVVDEDLTVISFLNLLPGDFEPPLREAALRKYVQALVAAKLVDEEAESITELGSFLELSELFVKGTLKSVVGPLYESRVRGFVASQATTEANKQVLTDMIRNFRVDDADVRAIGLKLYSEKVKEFFDAKQSFSDEELRQLAELRAFLLLSDSDADAVHEPLGRGPFMATIKTEFASLKPGQALSAEAMQRINDSARRLGLSESAKDDLMGEAMTKHLEPLLEKLKEGYKRATTPAAELAKQDGRDEGEDPFIKARSKDGLMIKTEANSNLMVDAVNIVQFLEDQDGFRPAGMNLDDESRMVKKTDSRPKRSVSSYICKASPSTFSGEDDEQKLAEEMYKAFVQTVASAPDGEKKEKYRVVQDKFGAALGIHPPRMEAIKFDLYATQMRKLVRGCLEAKGMLGADDNAELAKLNKDWVITDDRADRLVQTEKRRWLAGTLVSVISSPPNLIGPMVHKLRAAAASMGIDLSEDIPELTSGNRDYLFTQELRWLLEEGQEDADAESVADMIDAFGVKEEVAGKTIEREFKDAARQVCVDLMGNVNREDLAGAFRDLKRLVRIGRVVPLPLDFGAEAFLGMSVCAEIRRLWKAYAGLLAQPEGSAQLDLAHLVVGKSQDEINQLKKEFEEDNEVVLQLLSKLEALPDSSAEVDLSIDYRGRKVKRKKPDSEDMGSDQDSWKEGELELLDPETKKVVLGPDGKPMTIVDIIRKAIATRHDYMGVLKRKRAPPAKKGELPRSKNGMRPW